MRELRTAVMILAEASWQGPQGDWQTMAARIEDKSPSGACVRFKTPVPVGSRLKIQWPFGQLAGTCQYCRTDGWDYLVGIRRDRTRVSQRSETNGPGPLAFAPSPHSKGLGHEEVAAEVQRQLGQQEGNRMGTAMRELRTAVMILVEASWQNPDGSWQTTSARMEDKSYNGACIRVKTPIPVGSRLNVQWRFDQFTGTCKYCRTEGREFLIGIQRDRKTLGPTVAILPPGSPSPSTPDYTRNVTSPVLGAKVQSLLPGHDDKAVGLPPTQPISQTSSIVLIANQVAIVPASQFGGLTVAQLMANDRIATDLLANRLTEAAPIDGGIAARERPRAPDFDMPALRRRAHLRRNETPKSRGVRRERTFMGRNWLERAPWNSKPQAPAAIVKQHETGDRRNISEKENSPVLTSNPTVKVSPEADSKPSTLQVDLLSMEEIYRVAGVAAPQRGYSVHKVVEMMHSEHIRGLSPELQRAAVLMALDAAGVPTDQIQQDAKSRQQALDRYEAEQTKQAEAEWGRRAEENAQIEAEMERVKAHYMARINRNLEGVAREKAIFNEWLSRKRQETERMAEAVTLCAKPQAKAAAAGAGSASSSGITMQN